MSKTDDNQGAIAGAQQKSLFGDRPVAAPAKAADMKAEREERDFINEAIRRKLGAGPDLLWCALEGVEGGIICDVGRPTKTVSKGPRKGQHSWKGVPLTKVILSDGEVEAEKALYERESGKCWRCCGHGSAWCGWSRDEGNRYQTCTRCKGSGAAPANQGQEGKGLRVREDGQR